MRKVLKYAVMCAIVLLPFGWFLLACWLGNNATLGSLLLTAAGLALTIATINRLGAALNGLLSESERAVLNGKEY